jgi:hypothetical protein
MIATKVTVEDIKAIGSNQKLRVTLPDYGTCVATRNLVAYVRNRYKREDGLTYITSTDRSTNTIEIETVKQLRYGYTSKKNKV